MQSDSWRTAVKLAIDQSVAEAEEELGIPQILQALIQLPDEIARTQQEVFACHRQLDGAETEVRTIEALIMAEIAQEQDPQTKKAAFPNDAARQAELFRRRLQSPDWQRASEARKAAQAALDAATVARTAAENRFISARARASLAATRLSLIGGVL